MSFFFNTIVFFFHFFFQSSEMYLHWVSEYLLTNLTKDYEIILIYTWLEVFDCLYFIISLRKPEETKRLDSSFRVDDTLYVFWKLMIVSDISSETRSIFLNEWNGIMTVIVTLHDRKSLTSPCPPLSFWLSQLIPRDGIMKDSKLLKYSKIRRNQSVPTILFLLCE